MRLKSRSRVVGAPYYDHNGRKNAGRIEVLVGRADDEAVVGLLPRAHAGLRPESFFAATTQGDQDVAATAKIGVKVVRGHFCSPEWILKSVPARSGQPFEVDFSRLDKAIELRKQHGLSILPIVGGVDDDALKSSLARRNKSTGPPRDYREFTSMTMPIVSEPT